MSATVILIPVYNHGATVAPLLQRLSVYQLPVLFIDDGSSPPCADILQSLCAAHDWVSLLSHAQNRGKGAAVKTGLRAAAERGFTHAIQIDADGQHDSADIAKLLHLSAANPEAFISGSPVYQNVPALRFYARYLTHVWVWINTWSFDIEDSMCGLRLYPIASALAVIDGATTGDRMEFDTEIAVRLHWQGTAVIQFSTPVDYPQDGISHFRTLRDNLLISRAHARLFFGMLKRVPQLLSRRLRGHRG